MSIVFGTLGQYLGPEALALAGIAYGVYKFRRLRSLLGGAVAIAGTAGSLAIGSLVTIGVGILLGWWDPNLAQIAGDVTGAGGAAWDVLTGPVWSFVEEYV
ncbi:hypothetical protein [Halobaculum gomorrense]|uniref:Uncharacterized protein n=1 Tax=Halobaculum gomorrense TaxID=43928 RepID=A0A1M5MN46_9EURY|nr:hypothetical protein [Halobaculum gomorrense]SHG78607.1 hypothetical protein SAMN05443636_1070 [Halobaculum gomorrense]